MSLAGRPWNFVLEEWLQLDEGIINAQQAEEIFKRESAGKSGKSGKGNHGFLVRTGRILSGGLLFHQRIKGERVWGVWAFKYEYPVL